MPEPSTAAELAGHARERLRMAVLTIHACMPAEVVQAGRWHLQQWRCLWREHDRMLGLIPGPLAEC